MKTKYLILLALPYLTAFLLLFTSAFKPSGQIEEISSTAISTAQQLHNTPSISDSLIVEKDTLALMYKTP